MGRHRCQVERERDISGARWTFNDQLQESITIYAESPSEISRIQNHLFLGGLLLGFGINIIVKVSYDYAKERKHTEIESSTKKEEKEETVSDDKEMKALETDHGSERRINKLDSFFLWFCSLSALGFTVFVGYLNVQLAPYLPIFILIAYSVALGYVDGAILSDSFTRRIRGWNYLFMGLAIYIPFAATEFGKSQIQVVFPDIPRVVMYFQLFFGSVLPISYFLFNRRILPKLYESFRIPKGDVTNVILRSSFFTSVYLACILYISALILQYAESTLSFKVLYILFIVLFLTPLIAEEIKIRHLLRLEKNQSFVKHETTIIHRKLPQIAFGLTFSGIIALIVLLEFVGYLPLSHMTLYLSAVLLFLALLFPILGLVILMVVKARKDRFALKSRAIDKLSPNDRKEIKDLVDKLNDY